MPLMVRPPGPITSPILSIEICQDSSFSEMCRRASLNAQLSAGTEPRLHVLATPALAASIW